MARKRYNYLQATLAGSGLTSSATSVTFLAALTYNNGVAVPTLAAGDYLAFIMPDASGPYEIVWLTAYTSAATTGTIARGQEGTTAVAHTVAERLVHTATAFDFTFDDSQITPVTPNDQTGTSYTFVLADATRLVRGSNAGAIAATIPPNSSVAYPLGSTLQIAQQGAGQITLTAGAGVTLRTPHGAKTSAQYAIAAATKVATDEWYVSGDTTT